MSQQWTETNSARPGMDGEYLGWDEREGYEIYYYQSEGQKWFVDVLSDHVQVDPPSHWRDMPYSPKLLKEAEKLRIEHPKIYYYCKEY